MVEPSVPPLDEDQRSPQARHSLWLSRDEGVPDLPDTWANLRVRPLSPHRPRDCTGVAAYQSQLPAEIEPIAVEEEPRREAACGVRGLRPNLDLVAIRGQSLGQTPVAPVLYPRRSLGWARRLWKKGRNECTRCSRSRRSHRTRGTHLLLPLESSSSGPTARPVALGAASRRSLTRAPDSMSPAECPTAGSAGVSWVVSASLRRARTHACAASASRRRRWAA